MVSRSYSNLFELSMGGDLAPTPAVSLGGGGVSRIARKLSRVHVDAGSLSSDAGDDSSTDAESDDSPNERVIIVAHMLPLVSRRNDENTAWKFSWDEDALVCQLKDGLPEDIEVIYVGCLKVDVDVEEQESVAAFLLERFKCVPAFLSREMQTNFYHGFCKQQLWPLFHYMLPLTPAQGVRFDRTHWQSYLSANRIFADRVLEVLSPEDDFVWIHDYHLMILPTFLRRRFNKIKLGFFLHSPFPSSEIYRTLPVRDEILRALLNADLVGFHTFDYARHFLSCCSRMLGLVYESKRGHIGLEYYGRTVGIKIMPIGVHLGQLAERLTRPDTVLRAKQLKAQYEEHTVLLGVDDMDLFKGIGLKLLAMEQLLKQHEAHRGKLVLVQIINPPRGRGRELQELRAEAAAIATRINREYGWDGYQPVVLLDENVPLCERIAYYTIAQCCVVTPVRDGMNLIPYEYIVCREGKTDFEPRRTGGASTPRPAHGPVSEERKNSTLVISEFIGCSPSLSGAIRVNPWNIDTMAEAINTAVTMPVTETQVRHEKHFKYVRSHDVGFWAQSFIADLERICRGHKGHRSYGIGFGLSFKVVALDPNFRKLQTDHIASAYEKSRKRLILLDYDGTMINQASHNKKPSPAVLTLLSALCSDEKNVVFIVSGRGRSPLSDWFSSCEMLGIAAEHGYFYRWKKDQDWATCVEAQDFEWKNVAAPVMKLYTEATDGSFIEEKESAIVWHYNDADPDFGSWQAKELLDHLDSVLANEPVEVKSGQQIVEVKPQGASKGAVVECLLSVLAEKGAQPDFVLCVGDDRSDEDMFESIKAAMALPPQSPTAQVFACTVGQKPSKAKYYLDETSDVLNMLQELAVASDPSAAAMLHDFSASSSLATLEMSNLHI